MSRIASANRNHRNAFTLIELLVVVLILAILMSVAIPLYLSAVSDSQKKTCRANMQTIANAVQASKVKNQSADYSTFMGSVTTGTTGNEPDLTSIPACPNNGSYSIVQGNSNDNTTFAVSCNASGHGTFQPGVDHN
jgi:type IV pilus assembly protein PilA